MNSILNDLEHDHQRFRRYLIWLTDEVDRLSRGEQPDYTLLNMLAEYFSTYPDEIHHKKEDIIYAALAKKPHPAKLTLTNTRDEHETLGIHGKRFAEIVLQIIEGQQLPIDHIVDAAREYSDLLGRHMSSEEDVLFSPARQLFTKTDWDAISTTINRLLAEGTNSEKTNAILELEKSIDEYVQRND